MSIQAFQKKRNIFYKIFFKIYYKLKINKLLLYIKYSYEVFYRKKYCNVKSIFFNYKYESEYVHPFFKRTYYNFSPLIYDNYKNARLCHWIHHPRKLEKPFILEPNDHPYAPASKSEPWENIERHNEIAEVYLNPLCKKIIVESPGQMKLFDYYYGNIHSIIDKCEIINIGALYARVDWISKIKRIRDNEFNYICLASDFQKKGVDLVIEAWLRFFKTGMKNTLYLACPDIPSSYEEKMRKSNIIHIKKAPLSVNEKIKLHSLCDISIAPLHVDGGANISEAFENGLTVITMRNQRSEGHNLFNNCIVIDVPFYFYDTFGYGIRWKTFNDFFDQIAESKNKGEFETVVDGFLNTFIDFNKNPDKVYELCLRSYAYANSEGSFWKRNAKLLKIYSDILSNNNE